MYLKIFLSITFLALQFQASIAQGGDLCYFCGYMEDSEGNKDKIPSQDEDIPFCVFGVENATTVPVGMVSSIQIRN